MEFSDAVAALKRAEIDPDILNWVPDGQSATRWELIESGEWTLQQVIDEET